MKHTNFYALTKAIHELELKELIAAVQAHGGLYQWGQDEEKPIVGINPNTSEPDPLDVCITKVYVEDKCINIEGENKNTGEKVEFNPSDIFPGHIAYIIDLIPETETVSDVTTADEPANTRYALVEYPDDISYFDDNNIGYPCFEAQDTGARYVPESEYIKVFGKEPDPANLYEPICWPKSQDVMEDPKHETYTELINDEKGLRDFGSAAYWAPLGIY